MDKIRLRASKKTVGSVANIDLGSERFERYKVFAKKHGISISKLTRVLIDDLLEKHKQD